jgi:hypothetical protein
VVSDRIASVPLHLLYSYTSGATVVSALWPLGKTIPERRCWLKTARGDIADLVSLDAWRLCVQIGCAHCMEWRPVHRHDYIALPPSTVYPTYGPRPECGPWTVFLFGTRSRNARRFLTWKDTKSVILFYRRCWNEAFILLNS